jgi:type IV pilus assembly protein PilA
VATRGALFAAGAHAKPARRSAFTLGELAAVLAATCTLGVLGHTGYRTHQVRSEVARAIAGASELIPAVTEHYRRHGEVPAQQNFEDAAVAAFAPTAAVSSVTIVDGRIDVLFGPLADPAIAGRRISLTPYETVDRHVVWVCGDRRPGPGLEPLGFAAGGRSAVPLATTIEPRYLSQPCR